MFKPQALELIKRGRRDYADIERFVADPKAFLKCLDCALLRGGAGTAHRFWLRASEVRSRSRSRSGPPCETRDSRVESASLSPGFFAQLLSRRVRAARRCLRPRAGQWHAGNDSHG